MEQGALVRYRTWGLMGLAPASLGFPIHRWQASPSSQGAPARWVEAPLLWSR